MRTAKITTKPTTALALAEPTALAERPAFIADGDTRGTEAITANDIRPPALRLAQSNTPQAKRSDPNYVDGLTEGLFFNSLTSTVYGESVSLLIVKQLGSRFIEFGADLKVIDLAVPAGDPRTQFTSSVVDGQTKRVKPRATQFYDYLALLLHDDRPNELVTFSLKGGQLKKAIALNTKIKMTRMASFAQRFRVTSVSEREAAMSWYGWKIDNAGWPTEAQYREASTYYDLFGAKPITVEVEAEPAPDEPFTDQF